MKYYDSVVKISCDKMTVKYKQLLFDPGHFFELTGFFMHDGEEEPLRDVDTRGTLTRLTRQSCRLV